MSNVPRWGDTTPPWKAKPLGCGQRARFWMILFVIYCFLLFRELSYLPEEGVEYIAERYRVSEDSVIELATLLGVSPEDIHSPVTAPDSFDFPIDFYQREFDEFRQTQVRAPNVVEVESMVKGYAAKCYTRSKIEYFFYSTRVHPTWLDPSPPLVMAVVFHSNSTVDPQNEGFIQTKVRQYNLSDTSYYRPTDRYFDNCIAKYFANQGIVTPTSQP